MNKVMINQPETPKRKGTYTLVSSCILSIQTARGTCSTLNTVTEKWDKTKESGAARLLQRKGLGFMLTVDL